MNRSLFIPCLVLAALSMAGCYTITRTETDVYTVTQRDTTIRENVNNVPGQRENGTIYPSPRTVDITRDYVQRDSTVERHYPAFLRLGVLEAASFFSTGGTSTGTGNGLFGLYDLLRLPNDSNSKLFTANMYRLLPYEVRLRWFEDDPNWTLGTAASEVFLRKKGSTDELEAGEFLWGVTPLYIHKRIFLREQVPYIMVVPFFGLSLFPSQYVNLGASLDLGSYGGMNARLYAGFVTGSSSTFFARKNDNRDWSTSFPYVGIGVSGMDFVNKTEELFIEWKNQKHYALEVSLLNFDMVKSFSGTRSFGTVDPRTTSRPDTSGTPFPSGFILRFLSATYPIPIDTSARFFVGTSFLNMMALSGEEIAFGFLPIRVGYRLSLAEDQFNFEPFAEYTYYPGSIFHLGGRFALKIADHMELNAVIGYVNGSLNPDILTGLESLKGFGDFSTGYAGVGIGLIDVFHSPKEVKH